ncbi:DUF1697 domain-containing protein [Nocardiopsis sp. ARC36]
MRRRTGGGRLDTMTEYVALLRGINVGGHRRIAMADLRALLEDLGYTGVATYAQSGNAVFGGGDADPAEVAETVRNGIRDVLGHDVPTVVRTAAGMRAAVEANPFDVPDPSGFLVLFCAGAVDADALKGIDPSRHPGERMALVGDQVYTWHEDGIRSAVLPDLVVRHVDGTVTSRNWRTVLRLVEMVGDRERDRPATVREKSSVNRGRRAPDAATTTRRGGARAETVDRDPA